MRALITQREEIDLYGSSRDVLEADYTYFFEKNNISLQSVSNFTQRLGDILENETYDFIVLTGGGSLWEECYDCERNDVQQRNRDRIECQMVKYSVKNGIPILGICRGMQLLNAMYGGKISVLNNLEEERPIRTNHDLLLTETNEMINVNNFHNDGIFISNLADVFKVIALDEKNQIVEGFRSDSMKILGIQWHPERKFSSEDARIRTEELILNFINK